MTNMTEIINIPITLGNLELKNRIIFAPTSMGLPEDEYEERLQRIAAGGCAMIVIGDVPVGFHGLHSLYSEKGMARYRRLCELIHRENCLVCAQLHQSDSDWGALLKWIPAVLLKKMSADELRTRLNDAAGPYITDLPAEKVRRITTSFGLAAKRAKEAGFDMVQIHGDRMCGSFFSSLLNRRRDAYGGTLKKRVRFALEAVRAVRHAVPDMPIDFKLAVRQENPDYGRAGLLGSELRTVVPMLEKMGVNSFHVTLANHGNLEDTIPTASHPEFGGEGCFLKFCDEVKKWTDLPVCGVGGLTRPDFVGEQLASGRIDCAAMCRQLLADPEWPRKVFAGQEESIHRCVRCNKACLGGMKEHKGVGCIYDEN